jgi:hypothetical protein
MANIEKIEAYTVDSVFCKTEELAKDQLIFLTFTYLSLGSKITYHDLINHRINIEVFYKEMDRIRNTPIGDLINAPG